MKKLIMLETTDKSRICHLSPKGIEFKDLRLLEIEAPIILDSINYHLYLIDTDAEIKGYYHDSILNAIRHTGGAEYEQNSITNTVISTTNKSLNLPLFSEQSIKLAIDYFNRTGKKEVEVEVNETFKKEVLFGNCIYREINGDGSYYELINGFVEKIKSLEELKSFGVEMFEVKLNSDGKVDITITEEKMYSRKEVENLLKDFHYAACHVDLEDENGQFISREDWIKQNL